VQVQSQQVLLRVSTQELIDIMSEVNNWYNNTPKLINYTDKIAVAEYLANKLGKTMF